MATRCVNCRYAQIILATPRLQIAIVPHNFTEPPSAFCSNGLRSPSDRLRALGTTTVNPGLSLSRDVVGMVRCRLCSRPSGASSTVDMAGLGRETGVTLGVGPSRVLMPEGWDMLADNWAG
jgi:hypothetical protein